ncbi:MAG: 1-deoxy-D-xylulose-5-phosphate synthase, partial [Lachnospiraceae bacterium]|nr:1-deoxy-D-xylulose-5-phosphate synthase [Lachnospiraceae bacterium]
ASEYETVVTLEENVKTGGFGEQVGEFLEENGFKGRFVNLSLPDEFMEHGDTAYLMHKAGLSVEDILQKINY